MSFWHHSRFRSGLLAVAVIVLLSMGLVVSDRSGGSNIIGFALLLAIVALLIYSLASLLFFHDHDADALSERLISDPEGAALVARWLSRTRFYRNLGGIAGLIVWTTSWTNGWNGATLVAFGMGGILLGAIGSELHRARLTPGPRTASLTPRRITDYLVSRDKRRTAALVLIWLATAIAAIFVGAGSTPIVLAVVAMGSTAGVLALQWRVATRPRPSLPLALEQADDLCRELAITRSLAQPLNTFAVALLVPAFQSFAGTTLEAQAAFLVVVAWVTSVWWWAKNKRLGLDWLLEESVASGQPTPMQECAAQ